MNSIKKYKVEFFSFLMPFIILWIFFIWNDCLGSNIVVNSDMQGQYWPLFQYLKNLLHNSATFPYTFSKGLGGSMYATFFYYLSNPLNFLVYFFNNIPFFFLLTIILKISLSGLTMSIFLKHKFKKNDLSIVVFSLAYALSTYNINYYINIMWLDSVIIAPLLLLSIDNIIEKKKNWLYICLLFLSIYLNFYMGYILVLFSVLYFLYSYIIKYGNSWKKEYKIIINFFIITLLTGCMTAFILIPSGLELFHSMRTIINIKFINLNYLNYVAPLIIGGGNLTRPLNANIFMFFCGTMMIPLVICYFTSSIPKLQKICGIIMYTLFLLPIMFPKLNLIWHMFSNPSWFNYRYSFLAILFTIIIAYQTYINWEINKKVLKLYLTLLIILACSLAYASYYAPEYYVYLSIPKIVVTIIFTILSIALIIKNKKNILLLFCILELIINISWIGIESSFFTLDFYNETINGIADFKNYCVSGYRCEMGKDIYTAGDNLLGNYNGTTIFLTTANENAANLFYDIFSIKGSHNYYSYMPNIVSDTIVGIKRIKYPNKIEGYKVIKEENNDYILENPYALKLGYIVSNDIKDFKSENMGIAYEEELLSIISNKDIKFVNKLSIEKLDEYTYKLNLVEDYPYLYLMTNSSVYINDEPVNIICTNDVGYIIVPPEKGEIILKTEEVEDNFEVYTIFIDALEEFTKDLTKLDIIENNGNKIIGSITAPNKSTLMLSIPYEKGWNIYVDNNKVEYYSLLDSFIGIDLSEGTHKITMEYHVPGLKLGTSISVLSLLVLIYYENRIKHLL
ncbi:MAG: YfhO family protein [Bacilli bacterium]|nr:YfhO family protein [Bacilli bacterium]